MEVVEKGERGVKVIGRATVKMVVSFLEKSYTKCSVLDVLSWKYPRSM